MLSYELCSALKKAGFPQPKNYDYYEYRFVLFYDTDGMTWNNLEMRVDEWDADWALVPSLEDLLRELGDVGIQIWRDEREWKGGHPALQKNTDSVYRGVGGQTPEEVLAHLYLALHE